MFEKIVTVVVLTAVFVYIIVDAKRLGRVGHKAENLVFRKGKEGPGNVFGPWYFRAMGIFGLIIIAVVSLIALLEGWF